MSYFTNIRLRVIRSPWMWIVWASYPLVLGYIMLLSFGKSDSFQVNVGVVLPEEWRDSSLVGSLTSRKLGPINLIQMEKADPKSVPGDVDLSAILVLPPDLPDHLTDDTPVTIEALTNPRQRIKPAIVEEGVVLMSSLANSVFKLFGPTLDFFAGSLREKPSLDDVLGHARLWYEVVNSKEDLWNKIRRVEIREEKPIVESGATPSASGRQLFATIFWIMILANLVVLIGNVQDFFLRDLTAGMGSRWLASPSGLFRVYRDVLLFEVALGLVILALSWLLGVWFLGIESPPIVIGAFVAACVVIFHTGVIQIGYSTTRSPKAARAFVGAIGTVVFFLAGGLAALVPGLLGTIGQHLPIAIAINSLIEPSGIPWMLAVECLALALLGIGLYQHRIRKMACGPQ